MKWFNRLIHKKVPKSENTYYYSFSNCYFQNVPKGGDLPVIMPEWKPDPSRPPREHPDGTTD